MHDQIDGRLWAAHGPAFGAAIDRLAGELGTGFRRLAAIQFAAPWRHPAIQDER